MVLNWPKGLVQLKLTLVDVKFTIVKLITGLGSLIAI
jgi:hypothetical protein